MASSRGSSSEIPGNPLRFWRSILLKSCESYQVRQAGSLLLSKDTEPVNVIRFKIAF